MRRSNCASARCQPTWRTQASRASARSCNRARGRAVSIAQLYFARMDAIDRAGPAINAVIERNPDALAIAGGLDAERRDKGPRGPLHGIPVLLKDNIDTARPHAHERRIARAGRAQGGARCVRRGAPARRGLRDPRQDESFGMGQLPRHALDVAAGVHAADRRAIRMRSTATPAARARDRAPRSPPNLCAIAVGTETDGSIMSPSSCCGLVGIKPTVGLVSRSGIVPDLAQPGHRRAHDAHRRRRRGAARRNDGRRTRATSRRARARGKVHRTTRVRSIRHGLKGARIGIARDFFGSNDRVDRGRRGRRSPQ